MCSKWIGSTQMGEQYEHLGWIWVECLGTTFYPEHEGCTCVMFACWVEWWIMGPLILQWEINIRDEYWVSFHYITHWTELT